MMEAELWTSDKKWGSQTKASLEKNKDCSVVVINQDLTGTSYLFIDDKGVRLRGNKNIEEFLS